MKLIGPFTQILTLAGLPLKGAIADEALQVIPNGGVLVENGRIAAAGDFETLRKGHPKATIEETKGNHVLLPGFIACHTHICFAGNRAKDFAMRIAGNTYLEIAKAGGGIWDSVTQPRRASGEQLVDILIQRANRHKEYG